VAKKKDSVALFEVISKSRDKKPDSELAVPGWAKPAAQGDQAPEALEQVELVEQEQEQEQETDETQTPPPVTLQTTSTRQPRTAPVSPDRGPIPIWDTADGRLTLSLNYVSCMVAAMGILLLVIASFVVGRMTVSTASLPVETAKWQVGKFYLVIETLEGRSQQARKEADRMVEFCKANNEPCAVQRLDQNLIVWSMTPFDSPDGELAKAHALKIQDELGAKYQKEYGTKYKFSQQKDGAFNPEFWPYKGRAERRKKAQ